MDYYIMNKKFDRHLLLLTILFERIFGTQNVDSLPPLYILHMQEQGVECMGSQ
jgi:hypothetical protein